MKNGVFLFLILIFLGSCTIEKRLYNKGYHVEFNRGMRANTNAHLSEKQETVNNKVLTEVAPKLSTANKIKETPPFQFSDTIQSDATVLNELIVEAESERNNKATMVPLTKQYRSLKQQTGSVKMSSKTTQQRVKNETQGKLKVSKMTRSEIGSKIVDYLLLLLVVGLIVLGIAIPEVGTILLILLVVGIVAFIVWIILEIFGFFLDLLSFSWL